MSTTTARLTLRKPVNSDPVTELRIALGNHADALDDAALDLQGTLAARPASAPGSPGLRGRYYFATDTRQLFRDTGTSWVDVTATADSSITKAKLATDALNAFLKLAIGADRKAAFGVFNSGSFGNAKVKTGSTSHGLGATPIIVLLTAGAIATQTPSSSAVAASWDGTVDGTSFGWRLNIADGGISNNGVNVHWFAIA